MMRLSSFSRPVFGDGALYIMDYGSNAYANNPDDGLYRVSYAGCNPPVALAHKAQAPRT